jgi:nitrogen fixation protein
MKRTRPKNIPVAALFCALAGAGSTRCYAQEMTVLPDMATPEQWRIYQWNKAKGRLAIRPEFPTKVKEGSAAQRQSLGIKIDWPGGGDFQFFTVEPSTPLKPIPFTATEMRAWVNGSGTNHSIEAHFTDADGKDVKTGLGSTGAENWRQVITKIPTDWKQPLTFKNLTFHNWSERKAVPITIYVARLEMTGEGGKTTALPLSPALPDTSAPRPAPVGVARVVSEMNLPGEWRIPPANQSGGSLAMSNEFPADVTTDADSIRRSLQVNINFPGTATNGFTTFQVEPLQSLPIPFHLMETRMWLKGTDSGHSLSLLFTDADGKSVGVGTKPGRLDFNGWKQAIAKIPDDWQQPLTFNGIGFYAWGIKEPTRIAVGLARLEFVIDPKQPRKQEEKDTNDEW